VSREDVSTHEIVRQKSLGIEESAERSPARDQWKASRIVVFAAAGVQDGG
jgi:hypothetical protein